MSDENNSFMDDVEEYIGNVGTGLVSSNFTSIALVNSFLEDNKDVLFTIGEKKFTVEEVFKYNDSEVVVKEAAASRGKELVDEGVDIVKDKIEDKIKKNIKTIITKEIEEAALNRGLKTVPVLGWIPALEGIGRCFKENDWYGMLSNAISIVDGGGDAVSFAMEAIRLGIQYINAMDTLDMITGKKPKRKTKEVQAMDDFLINFYKDKTTDPKVIEEITDSIRKNPKLLAVYEDAFKNNQELLKMLEPYKDEQKTEKANAIAKEIIDNKDLEKHVGPNVYYYLRNHKDAEYYLSYWVKSSLDEGKDFNDSEFAKGFLNSLYVSDDNILNQKRLIEDGEWVKGDGSIDDDLYVDPGDRFVGGHSRPVKSIDELNSILAYNKLEAQGGAIKYYIFREHYYEIMRYKKQGNNLENAVKKTIGSKSASVNTYVEAIEYVEENHMKLRQSLIEEVEEQTSQAQSNNQETSSIEIYNSEYEVIGDKVYVKDDMISQNKVYNAQEKLISNRITVPESSFDGKEWEQNSKNTEKTNGKTIYSPKNKDENTLA